MRPIAQPRQPLAGKALPPAFHGVAPQAERPGNGRILGTSGRTAHDLGPLRHLLRAGPGAGHAVQAGTFFIG
jgi:hypothetical protein